MGKIRVFFLTTDSNSPSGGTKIIYHLVDMLRRNGVDAYALHQSRNFRYTWFENSTPVRYTYQIKIARARSSYIKFIPRVIKRLLPDFLHFSKYLTPKVSVTKDDLVVIPATRITFIGDIFPGTKKITLSQGPYLIFEKDLSPELALGSNFFHPDIVARITMSQMNYDFHRFCFPGEWFYNIPVFIDKRLFKFGSEKKKQIAYMPRRGQRDAKALINILKFRGKLHGFEFLPLDNMSQTEVSVALNEALIFLSFSEREGFGLPPAEAMACGCIVIGYSGNGGDEFFKDDISFKIGDGYLIDFAETIERVVNEYLVNPEYLDELRKRASEFILTNYAEKNTEQVLMTTWTKMMNRLEDD